MLTTSNSIRVNADFMMASLFEQQSEDSADDDLDPGAAQQQR